MTSLELDTISRDRIIKDIRTNFFVEAGAGSGKTTMLVSRMVAMVEAGVDLQKICAITFTKAAAGEFYDRFQKALIERSNPDLSWHGKGYAGELPAPTEETRERCADALRNIDLCFMGTIDSFCSMVLSEHPSEAKIPSDSAILSDLDAESLYQQIYVKICAGEYGADLKNLAGTFRALHRDAETVFVRGESLLMNNRNVTFHYTPRESIDLDREFAVEREEIIRALRVLSEHPELKYDSEKKSAEAWEKLEDARKKISGRWSLSFSRVLSGLKSLANIRLIPEALNRYGASLGPCFEPGGKRGGWLEFTPAGESGLLSKLNEIRYEASMTFLSACVPVISEAMKEKGAMTFFDYLYYLREMLKADAGKGGKLIRYISERHSYFLIDEFQDTNPMQAEVFFYLASDAPVEKWSACVPRPGALFIVGDPKQSIYRFRSADVTSFLKVKNLFTGGTSDVLTLSRNFRSKKPLISFYNSVFSEMLPAETEVQSAFTEIPYPQDKPDEFQGIFSYSAYMNGALTDHEEETDPIQIRKVITKLVGQDAYRISVEGCEPRSIRYSDIMIITYGKAKIDPIMAELDRYDIPMRVEGRVPFERNEALLQIFLIYRAVSDPDDGTYLHAALQGDFIGSCDAEMMRFRMEGGQISLNAENALSDDAHPTAKKVSEQIEKLRVLSKKALRLSPAALFSEIMDSFEVYRTEPAENIEVLYYTLELLRNAERTGIVVSLRDGAGYLAKLLSGASDEERCLSLSNQEDCVHIANLHKVKGLEAPVVILSACRAFAPGIHSRIVHGDEGSDGYVFSLQSERSEDGSQFAYFETDAFEDQKELEKDANKAEQARLIYVAATRARNVLILCDSIGPVGRSIGHISIWKPLLSACSKDILEELSDVTEVEQPAKEFLNPAELYEKAKAECVLNSRTAESGTYCVQNPSQVRLSSKLSEEEVDIIVSPVNSSENPEEGHEVKEATEAHRFPALLGTMTHRFMEEYISTKGKIPVEASIDEIIREYSTSKNEPYEKELKTALMEMAGVMTSGGYEQVNGAPKDITSMLLSAEECYTEVPFCYRETSADGKVTLWNGVMDVIYRKDGLWHILDYKTNIDGNDLDAKYRGQLAAYRTAFREITGEEASDVMTYHIGV